MMEAFAILCIALLVLDALYWKRQERGRGVEWEYWPDCLPPADPPKAEPERDVVVFRGKRYSSLSPSDRGPHPSRFR